MNDAERDAFLATTRLAMLSTLKDDGAPITVPVWFEWDGETVRMFSGATASKVRRLQRDARASVLIPNSPGEPESWVAFDGEVAISPDGAFELASRMAQRYWDMTDAGHAETVESWRKAAAHLRLLQLKPRTIRSSKG
jgi:PPOX class probable F420-dependent enzyme